MSGPTDPPRCSPQGDVPRIDLFEIFRKVRDEQAARAAAAPPPHKPPVAEAPQFPPPPPLDMDVEAARLREELASQVLSNFKNAGAAALKQADSFTRAAGQFVVDYIKQRSQAESEQAIERAKIMQDKSQPMIRRLYNAHRLARQMGGDLETEDSHRPQGGISPRGRVGSSGGLRTGGGVGGTGTGRSASSGSVGKREVVLPGPAAASSGIMHSDWQRTTHGGTTLYRSTGSVPATAQHIEGIVQSAGKQPVTIYSGVHGARDGTVRPERDFFNRDNDRFGNRPNVKVVDVSGMTPDQLAAKAKSTPGVVIVNTCNGDAVVK